MVGAAGTVDPASDPGKSSPRVLVAFCGDVGAPAQRPAVVTRGRGSDGASDAVLEGLAKRAADAARGGNDNRTSRRSAGLSKLFVRRARPRTSRIVIVPRRVSRGGRGWFLTIIRKPVGGSARGERWSRKWFSWRLGETDA